MPNLTPEWLKTALEVTGGFETDGNPWAGISNDFDGQGISCGILQWNIGQGSLQPIVKACGEETVKKYMPTYGDQLWTACNQSIAKGLQIVRSWQPNKKLKQDVLKELKALFGSPEMVEQQMAVSRKVGEKSMALASKWAQELRNGDPHLKEFCLFFDLVTQNGGMKNVWLNNVRDFIADKERSKVDDAICDWITSRPSDTDHYPEGKKNAALWKNIADGDVELFTLAYLRCLKSVKQYQIVALNRKGTIALTHGWVNQGLVDLPQLRNNNGPVPHDENISHGEIVVAGEQEKFVVTTQGLNLRSTPNPNASNIIATLGLNQEVIKLADSNVANWWQVRATIDGITKDGYVNRKYLAQPGDEGTTEVVTTRTGIVAVHLPTAGRNITRASKAGRAYPLTEVPPVRRVATDTKEQRVDAIRQLIEWFNVDGSPRYLKDGSTYCNIYAYDYCYFTGAYLPRVWWTEKALLRLQAGETVPVVYSVTQPGTVNEKTANQLNEWFKDWGGHFGWRRTLDLDELQAAANEGKVCITVAKAKSGEHNGHGHIVAVVPENDEFQAKKVSGKIVSTVHSQAGKYNHKYIVNHWWNDGTYLDFGHWIHD